MRTLLATLVAALTLSCAAHRPPQSIPADFAKRYGCNPTELQREADRLRQAMDNSLQTYVPQTGWTACDLIAHNGKPSRIQNSSGYGQTSQTWWYEGNLDRGGSIGMVRLQPSVEAGTWVVTYTSW